MQIAKHTWYIKIHPRRRPSSGGRYRSSNGAHKNLKKYGKPTRPKMPMVLMSRPADASQACNVNPVRLKGNPEAKLSKRTAVIRLSPSACRTVGLETSAKLENLGIAVETGHRGANCRHEVRSGRYWTGLTAY